MLEVVGWVRGDPVADVINASQQRTTPPAPKKRKNDGSLALSELTEEQRQRLKEHEERQKQLEVERQALIEESRHQHKGK